MSEVEVSFEEEDLLEDDIDPRLVAEARTAIQARCAAASITYEEVDDGDGWIYYRLGVKNGRNTRKITILDSENLIKFSSISFEDYSFLADYEAICSYRNGTIEAGLRPAVASGGSPTPVPVYRRLFGKSPGKGPLEDYQLIINSEENSSVVLEISPRSEEFGALTGIRNRYGLTLKISGVNISQHDRALEVLNRIAGSFLFQLDLVSDTPLILRRERRRLRLKRNVDQIDKDALQFPMSEFDEAPLSLYWYARSADEMPLLQFLAFYQVIEFYFPVYSQSEAQRKVKAVLKNPTFRGDRDTDIAKLLAAIHVSRSGSFGDERSQLRATIMECVDPDDIRGFIEGEATVREFYTNGSKSLPYHKVPVNNKGLDLRGDVAERIYDIRCKIVHTKSDNRDSFSELLLPFSKEAELLLFDIKLVQLIAQAVLISASRSYRV
ncbi:hypothetical protein [Pseudomonas germanica]